MSSPSGEKTGANHGEELSAGEAQLGSINLSQSHHKSAEERRLVLKQDLIIIPLMTLMYFFGYLVSRTTRPTMMLRLISMKGSRPDWQCPYHWHAKSLRLTNSEFYDCLMIFFVGFMVIELPAILLLRILGAQNVYGAAILLFGVSATLISVCGGFSGLMALRFFLGVGESVVSSGFLYLSFWYKRDELALRSGLFFVSSAVAGLFFASSAVAGLLSGVVSWAVAKNLEGNLGYHSWQWLFLIEGIFTIALGLLVFFCLPGLPDQAVCRGHFAFKSQAEKHLILKRLAATQNHAAASADVRQIWVALKDFKVWVGALQFAGTALASTAFVIFMPTFIKEIGVSALDTQLYSMIPYAFAIVSTLTMCYLSDRYDSKGYPIFVSQVAAMIGLLILLTTKSTLALMVGCCFVATGATSAIPISAAWLSTIHGGYTKKGTMFAVNQIFTQCFGIIATQIYNTPPRFLKGHGIVLGFLALSTACTCILYFHLRAQNRKRDQVAKIFEEKGERNPLSEKKVPTRQFARYQTVTGTQMAQPQA